MKTLKFIFVFISFTICSIYPQTQLLRVGNAVQYWHDTSPTEIRLTIGKDTVNGKEYFIRNYVTYPYRVPSYYKLNYERIEGDSLYFILSSDNIDSLIFNFNWTPGTIIKCDTVFNVISIERIDSVKIKDTFVSDDTVYYTGFVGIDLNSGDTLQVLPSINEVYKKFGKLYEGMWAYMEGVKIDGIRYGTVYPFPEEVAFSQDSIFVPSVGDSGNVYIVNNSDYELRIDSILSIGAMYGYRGVFLDAELDFNFYMYQTLPNEWMDTIGIIVPPKDSLLVSFYDVDLCPVCNFRAPMEYFIDTLSFIFNYTYDQNYNYNFPKLIQISGEGHTSAVEEDKILPGEVILYQNYPNPFNPKTNIAYQIPAVSKVLLKVFDILGRQTVVLVNEEQLQGLYNVEFDGSSLPSGIYFYRLQTEKFITTKKLLLLK